MKEKYIRNPKVKNKRKAFLKEFSGKTHTVITGVGIYMDGKLRTFSVKTKVTFRELDDVLIRCLCRIRGSDGQGWWIRYSDGWCTIGRKN